MLSPPLTSPSPTLQSSAKLSVSCGTILWFTLTLVSHAPLISSVHAPHVLIFPIRDSYIHEQSYDSHQATPTDVVLTLNLLSLIISSVNSPSHMPNVVKSQINSWAIALHSITVVWLHQTIWSHLVPYNDILLFAYWTSMCGLNPPPQP